MRRKCSDSVQKTALFLKLNAHSVSSIQLDNVRFVSHSTPTDPEFCCRSRRETDIASKVSDEKQRIPQFGRSHTQFVFSPALSPFAPESFDKLQDTYLWFLFHVKFVNFVKVDTRNLLCDSLGLALISTFRSTLTPLCWVDVAVFLLE